MGRATTRGAIIGTLFALLFAASAAADVKPFVPVISFGEGLDGSKASATRSVLYVNETGSPVQLIGVGLSPALADLTYSGTTCPYAFDTTSVPAGGSCTLTVKYAPATLGAEILTLTPGFSQPSGNTCPGVTSEAVTVSAVGVSRDAISHSPSVLTFPATPRNGASALKLVTLTNGLVPATIALLVPAGRQAGDFDISRNTCSGSTLAPRAKCTFGVRFFPAAPGAASASITIKTTTLGVRSSSITLRGTGTAPAKG